MNLIEFLNRTKEVLYPVPEETLDPNLPLPENYIENEEGVFEVKEEILDKNYENTHGYYLVFSEELKDNLVSANSLQPNSVRVSPISLSDGRYCVPADLLSETSNNGLYKAGFEGLNKNNFSQVEVIAEEELKPLLPVSEEEEV